MFYSSKTYLQFSILDFFLSGAPPPRFGKEFGSPQLDEVGDASVQVNVSAMSKMYRKREEALNNAIKTAEDTAKASGEMKGTVKREKRSYFS